MMCKYSRNVCFPQVFAYDYCFWSMDESQKDKFAGLYISTVALFHTLCAVTSLLGESFLKLIS